MASSLGDAGKNAVSQAETNQEVSSTAEKARAARRKAHELTQAAAGALDPKERQKLLNEALREEIESESFGKTASYLNSGTFQGLLAGSGLGTGIGGGLGTLTGILVGGTTSVIVGGLGGLLGSGVGALHGRWFKAEEVAGDAIEKLTGTIPGWDATPDQKKALEKMVGQVHDQDMPTDEQLESMAAEKSSGATDNGQNGAVEQGSQMMGKPPNKNQQRSGSSAGTPTKSPSTQRNPRSKGTPNGGEKNGNKTPETNRSRPRKIQGSQRPQERRPLNHENEGMGQGHSPSTRASSTARKKPRKLQVRS